MFCRAGKVGGGSSCVPGIPSPRVMPRIWGGQGLGRGRGLGLELVQELELELNILFEPGDQFMRSILVPTTQEWSSPTSVLKESPPPLPLPLPAILAAERVCKTSAL